MWNMTKNLLQQLPAIAILSSIVGTAYVLHHRVAQMETTVARLAEETAKQSLAIEKAILRVEFHVQEEKRTMAKSPRPGNQNAP